VHDAAGHIVGVVMLEDVIETLVGDVRDAMQIGAPPD
jgi:CBS domain containing-hemolysin-like protein